MKQTLILLLSLTCIPIGSLGQDYVDLARMDYNWAQPRPYHDSSLGENQPVEFTADIITPKVLNERFTLLSGLTYENLHLQIQPYEFNSSLHNFMLKAGLKVNHSQHLSANYLLLPRISSALNSLTNDDLQFGALALWKYQPKSIAYKWGLFYNSEFFGPFIVPIFGFYLKQNQWEWNFALPISADVNYELKTNQKLGLKFTGSNKSYHLNREPNQYLVKINNEIGPYYQLALGKLNLQIQAGTSFLRSYRTYTYDDRVKYAISLIRPGDDRTQLNQDFKNGFFIKSSLIYRLPIAN